MRLPAELIEYTIDFHHSDIITLKACSLVCRKWLPASRFHLLGKFFVYGYEVQHHAFVKVLASPSSTIASYVRILKTYTPSDGVSIFDAIAPHFKDFIMLKTISIEGMIWVPVSETSLSREFGRIGHMDLTGVYYDYPYRFGLTFTIDESRPSSFSSTLRVLNSAMCAQHSSWLPIVVQLPSVRRLDLRDIHDTFRPMVQAALKSGGHSIHSINLHFPLGGPGLASISDFVDLTHNTNLRSFSIHLNLRKSEEIAGHESFLKIIQRISSPSIMHIEISVAIGDRMDLTWLNCEKVADELNHPRFTKLQEVHFCILGCSGKNEVKNEAVGCVRRGMSCLDSRGILTVTD